MMQHNINSLLIVYRFDYNLYHRHFSLKILYSIILHPSMDRGNDDEDRDDTEHVTLLHSKNTDAKHELKRERQTKQPGGRSQLWGSWRPTL